MPAAFVVACHSSRFYDGTLLEADLRVAIDNPSMLSLEDEVESVEYVLLETTEDPASLVDGVAGYAVTSRYIYLYPVKEQRIVLFDRQGHFLRTLIPFGQGPGEFSDMLADIQVDEAGDRLYLSGVAGTWEYTLEGTFVRKTEHSCQAIFRRKLADECWGAIAFPYLPFSQGSFGLGIFTQQGDTVVVKNDFSSPLVPADKAGFTVRMAASYSSWDNSILMKSGANDTVFRMKGRQILPACILRLENSDKEMEYSLDATNFYSLRDLGAYRDIVVSDLFETPRRYYFRCRYKDGHTVVSLDKQTGEVLTESCRQPADLHALSDANLLLGMLGTRSVMGFPVWGRMEGDCLVQVITPYELSLYAEQPEVTVPEALQSLSEEANPVFVFYKLRDADKK